jgi:hypothetical protein
MDWIGLGRNRPWPGCNIKSSIFWDITPCSQLKTNRRFGGICRLHFQVQRISQRKILREMWQAEMVSFLYSTLKVEAICSSETWVDFPRTKRRYIWEDHILFLWHLCNSTLCAKVYVRPLENDCNVFWPYLILVSKSPLLRNCPIKSSVTC